MVGLVAAINPAAKETVMNAVVKEVVGNVIYINRFPIGGGEASKPKPPRARMRRATPDEKPSPMRSLDDKLVEQLVMGDPVAAERLKRRHGRHLLALAIYVLGDEEEARAAVQAAFEDAGARWPPERGKVKAWLRRLVRRHAYAMRASQLDRP